MVFIKKILIGIIFLCASISNAAEFEVMDMLTVNGVTHLKSSATIIVSDTVPSSIWISTSAVTPHLYIATSGKVGIGTNSPSENLHIAGNILISTASTNPILYASTTTGRVGIGTDSPAYELEIIGDLKVSDRIAVGANPLSNTMIYGRGADNQVGVRGYAKSASGKAIYGSSEFGATAIYGLANTGGYGVYGTVGSTGWAGYFTGGNGLYGSKSSIGTTSAAPSNGLLVSGDVGIGITVPTHKLHVDGGILATSSITASGDINAARYQINGSTVVAILSGTASMGIGVDAGRVNTGDYNVFVGLAAGYTNTSGFENVFVGVDAGYSHTIGRQNSFVGYQAGYSNTLGQENVFFGSGAGYSNTTGWHNSFSGKGAGNLNTTGGDNSFFGYGAGFSNTTGSDNTFVGSGAGFFNTEQRNTFVGSQAGNSNTAGSANAVLGWAAGRGNMFAAAYSSSTIMGCKAGFNITTGSDNLLLGFQSGDNITTGSSNIIIGYDEDAPTATTSNHLNIGGAIYGDLSTGKIGIGTATPPKPLHVKGTDEGISVSNDDTAKGEIYWDATNGRMVIKVE